MIECRRHRPFNPLRFCPTQLRPLNRSPHDKSVTRTYTVRTSARCEDDSSTYVGRAHREPSWPLVRQALTSGA